MSRPPVLDAPALRRGRRHLAAADPVLSRLVVALGPRPMQVHRGGRWTAEMYLMFRLGRADVLPLDDLGLRAAIRRAYGLRGVPKKERMRRIAEAWRPYRTLACFYLWRRLERPPKKD